MEEKINCPCKKKSCPRHGNCTECRKHHAESKRQWPVKCEKYISIRLFEPGDESELSKVISRTLEVSNKEDYSPDYLQEIIKSYSPDAITKRAGESHFYVVTDRKKIIGCGGITGYWGSTTESYLISIFVLPEYQGRGIGKRIIDTLEADEYFTRAWRTELASSITAVGFYRKLGYEFKDGITAPDEHMVVRLEKRKYTMYP